MILSWVQTKTSRRTKNTCSSDSIYLDLKLDNFTEDASSWACKTISTLKSKSCDGYVNYELLRASTPPYSDDQVFVILREFLQPDTAIPLKSTAYCILALLPEEDPLSLVVASSGELCLELAEQIPYHHLSQVKFARLLEFISRSTNVTDKYSKKVYAKSLAKDVC